MFFIVDEVQIGIGWVGDLMVILYEQVMFDIVMLSKILGNGLFLSVVVISIKINDDCVKKGFSMYIIYVNDFLFCVVGDKVFEIVMCDNLVVNVRVVGEVLQVGF